MRFIALSTLTLYLCTFYLCSCHSQKQVQSDYYEDVRLTNTTATTSSSLSLLDMVASWSADFGSLDIYVEPIDSCSSSAAVAPSQPSRLRLHAKRASISNKKSVNQSVRTDSFAIDTLVVHRTTQQEQKTNSKSSKIYKPPNATIVIITVLALCVFVLFVRLRKK